MRFLVYQKPDGSLDYQPAWKQGYPEFLAAFLNGWRLIYAIRVTSLINTTDAMIGKDPLPWRDRRLAYDDRGLLTRARA